MKKLIVFILCLVIAVLSLPVYSFADNETGNVETVPVQYADRGKVTAVSARSTDSYPVSMQEIEEGLGRYLGFRLESSLANYEVEVLLSDGSCHIINGYDPFDLGDNDWIDINAEAITTAKPTDGKVENENSADEGPLVFGRAYIDSAHGREILESNSASCTVSVLAKVYEYVEESRKYEKTGEYDLSFEKPLVEGFAVIKPVSGLPEFLKRGSNSLDLEDTVFEIRYYDGTVKQEKPVLTKCTDIKYYELDGRELKYSCYQGGGRICISYLDGKCYFSVSELKDYPYWDVEIDECVFEENRLTEITYTVICNDFKTTQTYTRKVTDPRGEYIDFLDGYYVQVYQTEETKLTSSVSLIVRGVSDTIIWAHDYDNIFIKAIANIVVFFQRLGQRIENIL